MPLIHDIQTSLLDETASVGAILLKLRFLASKLDIDILEEWVQYETEGYPEGVDIPEYRAANITYTGTFANIAQQLNGVSIPSYLVAQHAGEQWVNYDIRDGLPLIEHQMKNSKPNSRFGIDSSNLKVLLQNKIYDGMAIIEIQSDIDKGAFARVQHAVRAKTLDFTLQLEKRVPKVLEIEVGAKSVVMSSSDQENVENLTQHIFYGDVTNIHSSGDANSRVNLNSNDNSVNSSE